MATGRPPISKVLLALGSFVVGTVVGAVLIASGNYTSMLSSPPSANAQGRFIVRSEAVPKVPPLGTVVVADLDLKHTRIQLDGINCVRCALEDSTIEYNGGEFQLLNAQVNGPLHYELKGAALNTAIFLAAMGALGEGRAPRPVPIPPAQQPPVDVRTVNVKQEMTVDLASPTVR